MQLALDLFPVPEVSVSVLSQIESSVSQVETKPASSQKVKPVKPIASPAPRNKFALENQGLVRKVAHQMHRAFPSASYQDFFQIGMIGLLKACEKYDPTRAKISSFAIPYIKGECLHWIRDKGAIIRAPRQWQDFKQGGIRWTKKLQSMPISERARIHYAALHKLGQDAVIKVEEWASVLFIHCQGKRPRFYSKRKPVKTNDAMLAYCLNTTEDKYREALEALSRQTPTSDACLHYLEDVSASAETQLEHQTLNEVIDSLPDFDRKLIRLIYWEDVPVKKAARQLGISVEGVQIQLDRIQGILRDKVG